jgi:hypothetical protein
MGRRSSSIVRWHRFLYFSKGELNEGLFTLNSKTTTERLNVAYVARAQALKPVSCAANTIPALQDVLVWNVG